MNTLIKSLFVAGTLIACSATANAQSKAIIEIEVSFDRSASAKEIFRTIDKQTSKACKKFYRKISSPTMRMKLRGKCKTQLTENAVVAINQPSVNAYYEQKTGRELRVNQFAEVQRPTAG